MDERFTHRNGRLIQYEPYVYTSPPRRVPLRTIRPRAQRRTGISAEVAYASCAAIDLAFVLGFACAAFFVVPILLGVHR